MGNASKMAKDSDFDAIVEIGFRDDGTSEMMPCSGCEYQDSIRTGGKNTTEPGLYKVLRMSVGNKEKAYKVCPAFFRSLPEDEKYCERAVSTPGAYVEEDGLRVPHTLEPEPLGSLTSEVMGVLKDNFDAIKYLSLIDFFEYMESEGPVTDEYRISTDRPPAIPKVRMKISESGKFDECAWMIGALYGAIMLDFKKMGYGTKRHGTEDVCFIDFTPTEAMKEKLAKGIKKVYGNRIKDKIARFGKKLKG